MNKIYAITETWTEEQGVPTFHIYFFKNEGNCDVKLKELNKYREEEINEFGNIGYRYNKVEIKLQ